jgi:hypothetical protein
MIEIFNKLIKEDLTPNAYYVLHCIKEKIVPHNFVNRSLEVTKLKSNKWLNEDLSLTSKSIIFIGEINSFFKRTKKKTSQDLLGQNFNTSIQEYIEIFPNRKLSSGKYARTTPKNLETSFRWFFENYDYDWETIIKATEKYVDEYSIRNYEFMRTAQYFIRKQNIDKSFESDLATYCDIVNNSSDDSDVYFKERIV